MYFQIKSYLNFLIKSKNQHGLHSPFVYDLTTKCLRKKQYHNDYKILVNYRQELINDEAKITITDFGAGSKKLNNNRRTVNSIVKNAGISNRRSNLLYELVSYFNPQNILEIGTSLGIATASMALANPKASIISLEGCPETARIAQKQFNKFNFKNIHLEVGEFSKTLPKVLENKTFDIVYFDGNHQKGPTITYFEQCLNQINNNSVFIFDDIYWSEGMSEAWNYIKNHPKVTVSIDTFQWGLIFFRKEQPKQHFIIRI